MEPLREKLINKILAKKDVDREAIKTIAQGVGSFQEFTESLIKNKIVDEEEIILILSQECNLPYLDLDRYRLSPENRKLLPKELALRYKVLPLSKIGTVLTLATANPLDLVALDDIKIATPFKKIDIVLAEKEKIERALSKLYSEDDNIASFLKEDPSQDVRVKEVTPAALSNVQNLEDVIKESKLPPIVRIVDLIIYEGLKKRASDIHIEPSQDNLGVRYRIDGILQQGIVLPKRNQNAILARLKIMASLNITEFRIPQDGRFKIKFEGKTIDFRVSSLPTDFGEKIVLRILDKENLSFGLKNLGFSETPLRLFEQALKSPFGIILVTGPTGSGKSTTLYSVITQLNTPDKNIITIEDPVEYEVEGITQIQVKPEIGFDFALCLKTVLRQSPDVIMVGEIRDFDTADIAIKASLTGELIFSTLHTNNSVGAITRLVDMGIEPFLIASSLVTTTAQRLTRKLCAKCKQEYEVNRETLQKIGFPPEIDRLCKPIGCSYCNYTGYRGRSALLEVLSIDDNIREMIVNRAGEEEIIKYARQNREFTSLKEDGFKKCIEKITSIEEVLRVAG